MHLCNKIIALLQPPARQILNSKKFILLAEHSVIAVKEDVEYNHRQNVGCIKTHPFREADALTGINLFNEFVPAPAIASGAEGQEDEAAQRQDVVADEEVFQIKHAGAFAQRLKAAPDIEAENAGQGQQNHADNSKGDEATAVTAGQLADAGNNHFEYGNNSGHCRKEHEEEEESAPDTSAVHSVENVGQGDMKSRLGPASGWIPKLKHAGKIIRPATIATKVSRNIIHSASLVSFCSLPM